MTGPAGDALRRVAKDLGADLPALGVTMVDLIAVELPELAGDPRVRDLLGRTVLENVASALAVLLDERDAVTAPAPPAALEFARRLAQQGVPLTAMLRAYRLGQAAFQQEVIGRLAAADPSAAEIARAAQELSAVAFGYIDSVSEQVVAAYQVERDGWLRQRNASLLTTVSAVLDGTIDDRGDIAHTLGYAVAGPHVGAVLWSAPHADEARRLSSLERAVTSIAARVGIRQPVLTVASDASTVWAWLPVEQLDVPDVEAAVATPDGSLGEVFVALGEPAMGLIGFRTTHVRALQAQSLALAADHRRPTHVTTAAAIGPLALIGTDVADLGDWVRSVLGPLANDDEAHDRLRETVWSYLAHGSSLAAAAGELHLHKNTIQYRLRKAEEARGRPLHDARLELEVALLACRVLGRTVLAPTDGAERRTG